MSVSFFRDVVKRYLLNHQNTSRMYELFELELIYVFESYGF